MKDKPRKLPSIATCISRSRSGVGISGASDGIVPSLFSHQIRGTVSTVHFRTVSTGPGRHLLLRI